MHLHGGRHDVWRQRWQRDHPLRRCSQLKISALCSKKEKTCACPPRSEMHMERLYSR